ncbi:hypothetical protein NHX12_004362 [Muraenolepis orangiensis]|uniref:Ferric-chelate reductase 1 n=1 Tax=Muraenolepis orangiensis TaxID=630683 RepID=A0A9Q0DV29_9TELE|nr:hypothetical protein NHX12_004361 [Muraenolepis orangiensis]KAJ3595057.1 hypothetical protein NHX12_004362 [Muraenolepis orangiensis]
MAQHLFLLVSVVTAWLVPSVLGTSHLMFGNSSELMDITRDGCGETQLCVEVPAACDPVVSGDCLFASIVTGSPVVNNGRNLSISLRGRSPGDSPGYIAIGFTANASVGSTMLFICAQNGSQFRFFTRKQYNNDTGGSLSPTERIVKNILGKVNGSLIQCEFIVTDFNATRLREADITTVVKLGNGMLDGSGPGPFNATRITDPLNLSQVNGSIPRPTAASPATRVAAFISPACLLLWSSLSWSAAMFWM